MIIKGGKFRQPKAQKKFQKEIEKKGGIYKSNRRIVMQIYLKTLNYK